MKCLECGQEQTAGGWCRYCVPDANTTSDHLIKQQLMKWQLELPAAVQILRGQQLLDFQQLIADVANLCKLRVTETGTFVRQDPDVDK